MKKNIFKTIIISIASLLLLSGCSFLDGLIPSSSSDETSENRDSEIVSNFGLVTDDKLKKQEDDNGYIYYTIELLASESYKIKTTIDNELGKEYKLTYEKSSDASEPFTVSDTGLLKMPSASDQIFNEKTWFTSSMSVRLLKKSDNKKLASAFLIITCRKQEKQEYANISFTNEDLTYDENTKTYSLDLLSGNSYSVSISISYNTPYTWTSSLVNEEDSSFITVNSARITTNKVNEDKESLIKFETTSSSSAKVLDTVYLKVHLIKNETTPTENTFKLFNQTTGEEIKNNDVIDIKLDETLRLKYEYNNYTCYPDVAFTNSDIVKFSSYVITPKDVGTTKVNATYTNASSEEFTLSFTLNISDYQLSEIYCPNGSEDLLIVNNSLKLVGRVFAKYENNKTKDITTSNELTFTIVAKDSSYKTVTLSYKENNVTKSVSYDVRYFTFDEASLDETAFNYYDFGLNDHYGYHYLKNKGNLKFLVIPVWFTNSSTFFNESHKTQIIDDITPIFEAHSEDLGYYSVKDYYEKESNGDLSISATISSEWYESNTSSIDYSDTSEVSADKVKNYPKLADAAVRWYFENNPSDSISNYDLDNDNKVDAIILYYGANYYGDYYDNNNSTAFEHHENSNSYVFNNGCFISIGGLYNLNKKDVDLTVQKNTDDLSSLTTAYTFARRSRTTIHEIGHCFGNRDLYELKQAHHPAGRFNMQDSNAGRHDPFQTNLIGWTKPQIFESSDYEVGESIKVVLNDIESSKSNIILTNTFNEYNSLFDEYLLLEMYSPSGLNYPDSTNASYGSKDAGIRLWHVNAIINDMTDKVNTSNVTDGHYLDFAYSNFDKDSEFDLCHFIRNDVNETIDTTSVFTSSSLFKMGDSFSMEKYASQFVNGSRFDNTKEKLGWEFSVDSVFLDQDGTYGGIITLTRVDSTKTEFEKDVKDFETGIKQVSEHQDLANTFGIDEHFTMVFDKNDGSDYAETVYAYSEFNTRCNAIKLFKDGTSGSGGSITISLKDRDGYRVLIKSATITYGMFGEAPSIIVDGNAITKTSSKSIQMNINDEGAYGSQTLFDINNQSFIIQATGKNRNTAIYSIHLEYTIEKI